MMLTDLANVARTSGLTVIEVDGWKTRGHGELSSLAAIVCHHTAISAKAAGNYPSLAIVRDGRADLAGPLANLGLGRDGTVYVIAAGLAWHAGVVFQSWMDNAHSIGIEAEHDGVSPWMKVQVDAYTRLCAALAEGYNLPTARVLGHKEVASPAGRKIDPNLAMDDFRQRVDQQRDALRIQANHRTRLTSRIVKLRARVKSLVAKRKAL